MEPTSAQAAANLIYWYSIDNLPETATEGERALLNMVMGSKLHTVNFREKIMMRVLGYKHNQHVHGIDGYDPERKIYVEAKSEQADTIQESDRKKHQQLNGEATFGATLRIDEIQGKFDQEFLINHGFFWDGKLLAIFEFSSTLDDIKNSVKKYAMMRDKYGSKGALKYTGGCWISTNIDKTKCRWINRSLCDKAYDEGIITPTTQVGRLISEWIEKFNSLNFNFDKRVIHYEANYENLSYNLLSTETQLL